MKKIYALLLSVSLPIFSLSAKGSNPSAGTSGAGGGTNPASTEYVGVASKYQVGDFAEGGVVIYVTEDGSHGLVAAIEDANIASIYTLAWGPTGTITNATNNTPLPLQTPSIPYAQYYGGYQNQQIIEGLASWQMNYPAFAAAASYSKTVDGITYADWFLPSEAELGVIYGLKNLIEQVSIANGGEAFGQQGIRSIYWSSREVQYIGLFAWVLDFADGYQGIVNEDNTFAVRCVRAF